MTYSQSAIAWQKLANKMIELSEPDSPRTPKFNDLLLAIVSSSVRADERATGIGWPCADVVNQTPEECADLFKSPTHCCGDSL